MQGSRDSRHFVQSFTGSHRYVLDYLIEEVLEQQPQSVQSFLLPTAVLDRLTGSLCDALTGREDGQQTLETLDRANLFVVPLDEERHWYRYHHLFADLLRKRLRHTESELVPELHSRASKWYEQNRFQGQSRSGDIGPSTSQPDLASTDGTSGLRLCTYGLYIIGKDHRPRPRAARPSAAT
jgi:ATP/maltotriose-dependent transcriptional regulator MalT